jgi:hypothetical protein
VTQKPKTPVVATTLPKKAPKTLVVATTLPKKAPKTLVVARKRPKKLADQASLEAASTPRQSLL